ncbi:retinoid-inducible serine carboxypeptidase-like [Tripterygium wilfordii]|uniref:retinoid-inducible serine carboxypeptidase-like n=1 Tax=Tripterygium wilfordii TaxID=458696 RepID=UPI0018F86352|nr:retinoid-inducible serine carboxypeptidase-like [Tripterygium wilfordii]
MEKLQDVIIHYSNSVYLHNFLKDHGDNKEEGRPVDFKKFMNDVVKVKLEIIPEDVIWGAQQNYVQKALRGEIMKDKIEEVDKLLAKGINVAIYNGQVDIFFIIVEQ